MTMWTIGGDGVEVITSAADPTPDYRPLQGQSAAIQTSWMWQVLPDDLLDLPAEDRRFFESAWNASIQELGNLMTEVAHLDQLASLLDFPIRLQRKWLPLNLWRTVLLGSGDPVVEYKLRNKRGSRIFDAPALSDVSTLELVQGNVHRGLRVALTSEFTQRAAAAFVINLALGGPVTTPDLVETGLPELVSGEESWMLCGYGDLSRQRIAPGAYAALSTQGRVAAVVVDEFRRATIALASGTVDLTELQDGIALRCDIEGDVERRGVRVTVSTGSIAVSVEADATYTVSEFVLVGWDTRVENQPPYSALTPNVVRQPFTVQLGNLELGDPSVDARVVAMPSVQPQVSNFEDALIRGRDYDIGTTDTGVALEFAVFPEVEHWAEHTALDNRLIEKIYGRLLGDGVLEGPDSLELKNQIVALLNGYLAGPNPEALAKAIGALGGCPVAEERGVVIAVDTADPDPVIVVRGRFRDRFYRYNPDVVPIVSVGDEVESLQALTQTAELTNWTSDQFIPKAGDFLDSEIQKYAASLIEVPFAVDSELRAAILDYATRAFGIWTDITKFLLVVVLTLSEDLEIREVLTASYVLTLRDALTNARDPRYNDSRGFRYDGTLTYNEADAEIGALRLGVEVTNTGGAPINFTAFGTPETVAPAATETFLEPLP